MENLYNYDFAYYLGMVWDYMENHTITWLFAGVRTTISWSLLFVTICLIYFAIWLLEKILHG